MIIISNRVRNSRVGSMLMILPTKNKIKKGVITTLAHSETTERSKAREVFPFDISVHIIGVPAGHDTTPTAIKPIAKPGEFEKKHFCNGKKDDGHNGKGKEDGNNNFAQLKST